MALRLLHTDSRKLFEHLEIAMQAGSSPFGQIIAELVVRAIGVALIGSVLLTATVAIISR